MFGFEPAYAKQLRTGSFAIGLFLLRKTLDSLVYAAVCMRTHEYRHSVYARTQHPMGAYVAYACPCGEKTKNLLASTTYARAREFFQGLRFVSQQIYLTPQHSVAIGLHFLRNLYSLVFHVYKFIRLSSQSASVQQTYAALFRGWAPLNSSRRFL